MKPIWRIFSYLKFFPKEIALIISFNVLAVLFNLFSFVLIIPFAELLFGMTPPPATQPVFAFNQADLTQCMLWWLYQLKGSLGPWYSLLLVAAGYLLCNLLSNLCRYLASFFMSPMRNGMVQRLRGDIYRHITILPVSYFNSRRRGDILSRLSNDLYDIEWSVVSTMQSLVKDPINILLFAFTLIFISPKLFGFFLVILPVAVFFIARIAKSLKRSAVKGQAKLGGLFGELDENLAGIRAIKAFGREQERQQHFETTNHDYARTMIRVTQRRELSSPLSEVLGTLGLVAILIIGGLLVFQGEIASSVFIFFVIIFARLIPPVQAVVKAYNSLVKGSAAAGRVFELLDADEKILEQPNATILDGFYDKIEYRHISFSYEDTEKNDQPTIDTSTPSETPVITHTHNVLCDINFTIRKGQTIALVGPSGAGKTTLVDLLPRFYDCTNGDILVDGHSIRTVNINSLRRLFGLVSQNCILFNDSVANNIAFGNNVATREQIEEAARLAYADDFIRLLPNGYDTQIGDLGITLSGGQRQRLSIARAMLKNAPILILDEATSALDNESELAVQQALVQLMQQRTSIVIAHRLSTIRNANEIIVLDQGRIVERGSHDSLIQQHGLYKKLVDMQSFA